MDGGAWWATVHGVSRSRTRLSDFTFTFHFHALEKEMATHSSVLAWRIPGTREPGGLPSMGLRRVGHDWSDLAAAAIKKDFYADVSITMLTLVLDACGCHKIFPQIGALKQEKLILSHFGMLEIQNQGADRAASFWWFRTFLGYGCRLLISASVFTWSVPFLCVCVCVCVSPLCMSCSWQKDNLCRCLRDQILCKCCHTLLFFSLLFFI